MVISKELKLQFLELCKSEFSNKSCNANETNKRTWFYVQAGTKFQDELHYEFYQGAVHLHIEMKDSEELQSFLYDKIQDGNFEWRHWNKPNHCCTLNFPIENFDQLRQAFIAIRGKIEPVIMEYEKQPESTETNVTLEEITLRDVLAKKLIIPDYQRIYCWTEKNVHKLLDDLRESLDRDYPYHLGSLILHNTDGKYAIVDGQQRLVTLSLLLLQLGNDQSPLLNEKFESQEAQDYIAYNKTLIKNYVARHPDKLTVENILKNLGFSVLIINDGSLDLAYTFFSNQNSRGKSLTDYDLLKAHHLRFVHIEKQATHLAERWDNILLQSGNDATDRELGRTFGIYLFRLRKWMRKKQWGEDQKFKVKDEFEAMITIPDIPPFGEKFHFYESIQGGSHFFAYADHFIFKFRVFAVTDEYKSLKALDGESHWWYRDVIETLLFAYYLKFDTIYLSEALYCIEQLISDHRYGLGRSSLRSVLEHGGNSEIVMMIDQATSPTFFLAECLSKIQKLTQTKNENIKPIQKRYRNNISTIHSEIVKNMCVETFIQLTNSEK